jgi:hypothetical protein
MACMLARPVMEVVDGEGGVCVGDLVVDKELVPDLQRNMREEVIE